MDRNRVNDVAEIESSAGQSAGLLELWDGASQIMWDHAGVRRLSACRVDSSEQSLLQRLREWCYSSKDKKGQKRRELDVSTCFGPLLQWILAWWEARSAAPGAGRGCDDALEPLYRAGEKPGVSGLCHSGSVESRGCSRKGSLGTTLDEAADEVSRQCSRATSR